MRALPHLQNLLISSASPTFESHNDTPSILVIRLVVMRALPHLQNLLTSSASPTFETHWFIGSLVHSSIGSFVHSFIMTLLLFYLSFLSCVAVLLLLD